MLLTLNVRLKQRLKQEGHPATTAPVQSSNIRCNLIVIVDELILSRRQRRQTNDENPGRGARDPATLLTTT